MNYYSDGIYAVEGVRCRGIVHTVRPGDTLYKISRLYGVTLEQLMDQNEDVNVYNLQIGGKICVPVSGQQRPVQGVPYQVRPGDNLNSILRKYRMTFEMFEKYNPQMMPVPLKPRTVIYLPPDKVDADIDKISENDIMN